ncbi:hypothetical protein [Arthrobacter sp. NicSoilC5]|uniref:hypothetical protein n=1 Tax=Arthrobacter sp. NicSoilC5 TaxID=2831000 RepID=UPI001CC81FB1|nr:hypothetical protein [Arthrobacter sp. NicSoilC5]
MDPIRLAAASPFFVSVFIILGAWGGQKISIYSLRKYLSSEEVKTSPKAAPLTVRECLTTKLTSGFIISRVEKSFVEASSFVAAFGMFIVFAGLTLSGLAPFRPLLYIAGGVCSFIFFAILYTMDITRYRRSFLVRWKLIDLIQATFYSVLGVAALMGFLS